MEGRGGWGEVNTARVGMTKREAAAARAAAANDSDGRPLRATVQIDLLTGVGGGGGGRGGNEESGDSGGVAEAVAAQPQQPLLRSATEEMDAIGAVPRGRLTAPGHQRCWITTQGPLLGSSRAHWMAPLKNHHRFSVDP